jgi:ketosteroid isomerase-like protein
MADPELRARREAVVRLHMESENRQDFDSTMGTFAHPRYELIPTGKVFDGAEAVRAYYRASRTAVPDQRNELIALHHADDAVVAEFWLRGTPTGQSAAAGSVPKSFECRMAAVFTFEGELIVSERVYWDQLTIQRQLG